MEDRPATATELDQPSASLTQDVGRFVALIAHEQARHLSAIGQATAMVQNVRGPLPGAAALQVRLTQQYFDGQRAILRLWADADAKVDGIIETAQLEAAVLGLRIDGLIDPTTNHETRAEASLRALLESWWDEARTGASAVLDSARQQAEQWVEVAHLANIDADLEPETALVLNTVDPQVAVDDSLGQPPARHLHDGPLARELSATLEIHRDRSLESLLDELEAVLDASLVSIAAQPGHELELMEPVPVPSSIVSSDTFDRFWGSGPSDAGRRRRRVLWSTVAPMLAVPLALAVVLVRIG